MSIPRPVELRGVGRRYGDTWVVRGLDLEVQAGETVALSGPNGCGKTTVVRLALGLDAPDEGSVLGIGGRRRGAAFQEDRLCEHLSAVGNVRLVLDRANWAIAPDHLALVGLDTEALAKPVRELSGGQRRRVAIVRALAGSADLVMLDEPFTGIDTAAKPAIIDYVRERLVGRTALLVTHDPAEAYQLAARVVTMGR
jgi:NitT/TauT family transport system ATP-binding protein